MSCGPGMSKAFPEDKIWCGCASISINSKLLLSRGRYYDGICLSGIYVGTIEWEVQELPA